MNLSPHDDGLVTVAELELGADVHEVFKKCLREVFTETDSSGLNWADVHRPPPMLESLRKKDFRA